jgi:hypothetical protein
MGGHVACVGERRGIYRVLRHIQDFGGETLSERDHVEDPGVVGRVIL